MNNCIITFRSVTGAQVGSRMFERLGIYHRMTRTPKSLTKNGCGYALTVKYVEVEMVVALLKRERVTYIGIYGDAGKGEMEELNL